MAAPETTQTLDWALDQKVSQNIRAVLQQCRSIVGESGRVVDISVFLGAAQSFKTRRPGAEDILRKLFRSIYSASEPHDASVMSELPLSGGLARTFDEAGAVRKLTGGQDNYIGMRHILFVIFTSTDDLISVEANDVFERAGADRNQAVRAIIEYCDHHMEERENRSSWSNILLERGLPPLGSGTGLPRGSKDEEAALVPDVPSRVWTGPEVAVLGADDAWAPDLIDRAGALAEADAFAAMIATREFKPPLAIGVFGEWGSGKSFFMRLVHDAIDDSLEKPKPMGLVIPSNITTLENIVQIRFNAWHYAETNLWASLVEHIFTCLDAWARKVNQQDKADLVLDRLATARRLTIESAEALVATRRERDAAADRLKSAQADLTAKKAKLAGDPVTWAKAAFTGLFGDEKFKATEQENLKKATELLGLGDATESAAALQAAAGELDDAVASYDVIQSAALRYLALPFVVILVTILVVIIPPLLAFLSGKLSQFSGVYLSPTAAAISGALAPIVAAMGWAANKATAAANLVRSFHKRLQAGIDTQAAMEAAKEQNALKDVEQAEARVSEAEQRLRVADEQAAHAADEYNLKTGKGRALRFVRERVENGDYAKHLGFIATVRKDFEELSLLMAPGDNTAAERARASHAEAIDQLMKGAGALLTEMEKTQLSDSVKVPEADLRVFERIVLYVDDLDRCPPKQVVDVLQAIHMLLTFPLFVVMVAVDVRWVRRALTSSYPGQIVDRSSAGTDDLATPGDYLEKIFQIPYWVRAMSADNTRALLDDRLGPVGGAPTPNPALGSATSPVIPSATPMSPPKPPVQNDLSGDLRFRQRRGLQVVPQERQFIAEVAEILDHSPRRTLRFINSYRLIKASLDAREVGYLEARGYRALLTLLAVTTCSGAPGAIFISILSRHIGLDTPQMTKTREEPIIQRALKLYDSENLEDLYRYAPLAARFSFEDRR